MCGISGIIKKNGCELDLSQNIKNMNKLIVHRGPDAEGTYIEERIGLGHRRLSIVDLNEKANQPFSKGDYILVYNGEIYNHKELRRKICEYNYQTSSDTEVIIAAYEKWGTNCVQHFRGMWAFLLYDKNKNIIFGSRDRFGIKPLYYYETNLYIAFASEIKQFTVLPEWKAIMNQERVQDFITFGVLDGTSETMFKGVYQVEAGYNLVYDVTKKDLSIYQYYDLEEAICQNRKESFDEAKKKVYKNFEESVREHIKADVKVGSCLSGGIDSSSIVVMMEHLLKGEEKIETISSCFEDQRYDEQEYIDEVSKSPKIKAHKVFPQVLDLLDEVKELVWYQDEPFGSTSIFAQRQVFKGARDNNIKVMLDGQGADEQLMGYHGFYQAYFTELFLDNQSDLLDRELETYQESNPSFTNEVFQERCIKQHTESLEDELRNRLNRPDRMLQPDFDTYYNYYQELNEAMKTPYLLSIHQMTKSSLPALLHYEDRNSMTYSIESRVPFLDHRFVEYMCSLPTEYKLKMDTTKFIFREAMEELLPIKIKNRRDKMGFVTPELIWVRENREVFKEYFHKGCTQLATFINKEKALRWFDEHIDQAKAIDFTIWRIICTGIWIETFNVQCDLN